MTARTPLRFRPWRRAVVVGAAFAAVITTTTLLAPSATAASSISFVGVSHSDPASQKFKQAVVPSTAQVDDTLIMVFTRATAVTWTGPTGVGGWTQVDSFANGALTSTVYRKTATGGDPGATVRFDTANFAKALLTVSVYRGVDTAAPLVVAHVGDPSAVTTHNAEAVTATADDWVTTYWADRSDTTTAWSAPASTTPRDVVIGTGTGRYSGVLTDSGGPVAAGTYGPLAAVSTPATRALMWTIVLPDNSGLPPPNEPPTAAFTSSCSGLVCSFDGTDSTDSDGTVVSYAWDFGDGGTATGATPPPHTFAQAGTYNVSLKVTDDDAATDTFTLSVTVDESSPAAIAFVGASHSDPTSAKFKVAAVPAGAAAGDTALMTFTKTTTVTWTGPTGVTGWTQVSSSPGNGLTSTVWRKTLAAADLGNTVRFDAAIFAKAMLTVSVYSGVSTSEPVQASFRSDGSGTSHLAPAVPAAAGDWVASYWTDKSDTTSSWTAATGVTTRDVAIGTGTGHYSSLLADSGGPVAAGSYSGRVATTDVSAKALMWSIVLPGGTPPPPSQVTKLLVIMEENQTVSAYDGMPYMKGLSNTYGQATTYTGLVHPSEGNYIAIASGQGADTCGLNNPLPAGCSQPGPTVYGQALSAGKTAKIYAESMVSNCQKTNNTLYAARHNPWAYFPSEATPCASLDVPLGTTTSGALASDIDAGQLPNASMVVPNLMNDAHDGTLQQADDWLALWIPRLMAGPDYQQGKLAIVVTFDEGIGANQNIPFVLVHPSVSQVVVSQPYNHYGLTRMYDDVLGVAPLNAAADAPGLKAAFGL